MPGPLLAIGNTTSPRRLRRRPGRVGGRVEPDRHRPPLGPVPSATVPADHRGSAPRLLGIEHRQRGRVLEWRAPERVCFQLQRRNPELHRRYRARHAAVWPDMLRALKATGWNNYSLFLRDDGLLIGYFETDDSTKPRPRWRATDVNARWQAEMADFFVDLDGAARRGLPQARPKCSTSRTSSPPRRRRGIRHQSTQHRTESTRLVIAIPSDILTTLEHQAIELPSWAFGNSGTRFKVFATPGTPRDPREDRRRRPGATRYRRSRRRSRCTSRGTRSTTTPPSRSYADDHGVELGTDQLATPSRTTTTSSAASRHDDPPCARRPSTTTSSASTSWTRPARAT